MLARVALQTLRRERARAIERVSSAKFATLHLSDLPNPAGGRSRHGVIGIHRLCYDIRPQCPRIQAVPLRTIVTESVPLVLLAPIVFTGLLLTLWTYKCVMMVLFQDKIIYMPYMPPFARSERIEEYAASCKPVEWKEQCLRSLDGTKISVCIGQIPHKETIVSEESAMLRKQREEVVIAYFQGNGGSLPPRLPVLSSVLKRIYSRSNADIGLTVIALSYRGYWTSSGRASQSGIELDAQALLDFVSEQFSDSGNEMKLVLWGQSIGAGIATGAAAKAVASYEHHKLKLAGLVLETPFTSIDSMLAALYPQKWLPYRYLWPFLWNHWDSEAALRRIASCAERPKVLLLPATRDEVVPAEEADKLESLCRGLDVSYDRIDVLGALHNEASVRRSGQDAVANFILEIGRK